MDRIVEKGMLFDYYGSLLTDRQQQIYEDAVSNDLSLSELADTYEISRQGVHDLLKRCDRILAEYEEKLGCVRREQAIKKLALELKSGQDETEGYKAENIADEILKLLA